MKIPITMCHGVERKPSEKCPLTKEHFARLMKIVHEMGFQSINYDQLAAWRAGTGTLPARPIMLDFDHPVASMRCEVFESLSRYGFKGNLFVNTGIMEKLYSAPLPPREQREIMTWEELGELVGYGWHIGAHTHTHPNLSKLSLEDATGEKFRAELLKNNEWLQKHLGITPKDFAFTGTSWSSAAEREVMRMYRFGRLWIIGSEYQADGKKTRYGELAGVPGTDEPDGGPPKAARYITKETPPYRLPSMEIQALIHNERAFRTYLEEALT
jgi:peptidoglycan/xylan/chitin deacetylase (PgdA/CDA1 family)